MEITIRRSYINRILTCFCFLIIFASSGVKASGKQIDKVLAIVNDDTITTTALDKTLIRTHSTMDKDKREKFNYRRLLDKLVNDRLIIQEAEALGMGEDERLLKEIDGQREENARKLYVANNFKQTTEVSDSGIMRYFLENYGKMQLRTVSVGTMAEAESLIAFINKGASMDSIAKDVSVDPYKYKGGLRRALHLIDIENIHRKQAAGLKDGEISKPFRYRDVYSFLKLEKSIPPDTTELPLHLEKIKAVLQQQLRQKSWVEFIQELRERNSVVVNEEEMGKILQDSVLSIRADSSGDGDRVVITMDEKHYLTVDQLRRKISHLAMREMTGIGDSLKVQGLNTCIEDLVLLVAAENEGYLDSSRVMQKYAESTDSALIEAYLQEFIISKIVFNKKEFEDYYQKNIDQFTEPKQCKVDMLIVDSEEKASEITKRLEAGAAFEFIAKEYQEKDSTAIWRQDEWIGLDRFPEPVAKEISRLKVGNSSRAYQTDSGWTIIWLRDERPGRVSSLEESDMKIRDVMFQRKFAEFLDSHLKALKKRSKIVFKEAAIKKYFGEG